MNDQNITRIFKIGSSRIVEDESLSGLSIEEVRDRLKRTYPEVANATFRQKQEGDTLYIEFMPVAGRKG